MAIKAVQAVIAQQAAEVVALYRRGEFWVAVRTPAALKRRSQAIEMVRGHNEANAFVSSGSLGANVLWCAPGYDRYRPAMLDFLRASGHAITATDLEHFDVDHAFHSSAALARADLYGADAGFMRMNLIGRGPNRTFGAGIERRQTHRIFSHKDYCEGNLGDVLKASNFSPSGLCRDPWRMMAAGVDYLCGNGLIAKSVKPTLYNAGLKEYFADQQASAESYARETGQL